MAGRKVNADVIVNVKKWVEGGAKDKIIANAFNFSVATVQNIKRTGFNYGMYRKLVNKQLNNWSSKFGEVKKYEASKIANINSVKAYLDDIVKKLDELTVRFDTIFPKVKQRGKKTNERNNSNI
jgi:hypothetical protein|tara:strand:+ start:52 stop:423 length:372 start_codon:yes stop_codon:yes gene_type:complete